MRNTTLRDVHWIRQAFLLPEHAIDDPTDSIRRVFTSADQKFTDTTLGGNWAVNSLPQFTRYADIKRPPRYSASKGMGRFYSEVIDDNAQLVHFRLGVPKFNSLQRYFGDFYNAEAASLARTGRARSVMFDLGRAAGFLLTLPLQPVILGAKFVRLLIQKPASRYYYLKPTMPLYWNAVSSMVNGVAVNLGIIPRVLTKQNASLYGGSVGENADDDIARYHALLPDIIRPDGGIDIYAVANRAQRLANVFNDALEQEVIKSNGPIDLQKRMQKKMAWVPDANDIPGGDLNEYLNKYLNSQDGAYNPGSEKAGENDTREPDYINSIWDFYNAERRMGSEFVTFRVDHTGTSSESFNNSTTESSIASTINSTSSSARSTRFSLADGNLDAAGISAMVTQGLTDLFVGVTKSVELHGISALAGSAFADIPKTWDSSSADIGRSSFTIPLRSPYGHDLSRLQNLIVPICMLVAMSVPLSTGKQSYTSPFILEMFNQGRTQIRLGMVESLSITRGVGDIGWNRDGKFLGVDVSITIIDLSSVLHMPISAHFNLGEAALLSAIGAGEAARQGVINTGKTLMGSEVTPGSVDKAARDAVGIAAGLLPSTYDDDNVYTDYLAVLGSLPLEAQINPTRKIRLRMTQKAAEWNAWRSPAHLTNWAMGGLAGDALRAISGATNRP